MSILQMTISTMSILLWQNRTAPRMGAVQLGSSHICLAKGISFLVYAPRYLFWCPQHTSIRHFQ